MRRGGGCVPADAAAAGDAVPYPAGGRVGGVLDRRAGCCWRGPLDAGLLRRAWELVVARHAVLRTAVVWDGVPEPLAVVSGPGPVPWLVVDASGLDEAGRAAVVPATWPRTGRGAPAAGRRADAAGADPAGPGPAPAGVELPPPAAGRVERADRGRAGAGGLPRAGGGARAPARPHRPFRDYVAWLGAQDLGQAREYWRGQLAGLAAATSPGLERSTGLAGQGVCRVPAPPGAAAALGEYARRRRLTVNTVVLGAWAVLLGRYAGSDDVVLGVTTSGRGGQVEGMDSMVGLLMNTTPARIRIDPARPAAAWLAELQDQQARARRYEHTPLVDIQACSPIPPGQPLFTTLFVFENYPVQALENWVQAADPDALLVERNLSSQQINHPLGVTAGSSGERNLGSGSTMTGPVMTR